MKGIERTSVEETKIYTWTYNINQNTANQSNMPQKTLQIVSMKRKRKIKTYKRELKISFTMVAP